ncbi:MAG: hypothetical protein ABEJ36_06580 [Candidatus Nanosalina sp.]
MLESIRSGVTQNSGMVKTSEESQRHKEAIEKLASAYERSGFEVKADHIKRFEYPEKIKMLRPDIVAEKDGKTIIVEVKTRSAVGTDRDKRQRRRLSEWAKKDGDRDFRREVIS